MAILRSEVRNKFTTIPNSIIRCKDLSDGDFRLLIYLYSLPDKWKINQSYLGQALACSRININKKIRRIKEAGYLEITKGNKENDTDYIYILKEKDVSVDDVSLDDVSLNDVSLNDTHINTNIINTDIINTNNIKSRQTFKKPTIEEIQQYCLERNNGINAEAFYDFYESKNWMIGKNKMKDWKACVRTWEKRETTSRKRYQIESVEERNRRLGI